MEQIALGTSGRHTTRLGFGCSSLMGSTGRRDSLKLLETAYDAGIRHFDVAPMYGYGEAERCLGELLEHHRDHVTVATKYGIARPKKSSLLRLGRRIAGPIVRQIPQVKQHLARAANVATGNDSRPSFSVVEAKASLDCSLTTLRTDHIDLWLLHEAQAADLHDDSLLRLFEDEVKKGTIGSFGVGSSADKIPALVADRPSYCHTLQYDWSILDAPIHLSKPFRIHHRSLTNNFHVIHSALSKNKTLCRRWSESINTDLSNPEILANLMLKASLLMNPASIILFSSKNPTHIQTNVRIAADITLEPPARELYNLVQAERDQLLPTV
jgi:D-threo-aldose 1-dehydrogenase